MTGDWPGAELNAVQRLRALAGGVSGAAVTERVVAAPLPEVWRLLSDFEGAFREIQTDMHRVRVLRRDGERVEVLARSRYGMRARFRGVLRPGWCWLQSRFLVVGMAAAADPAGGTRVAVTGGIRVPGRAALVPVGVRREGRRALDRLERLLNTPQ